MGARLYGRWVIRLAAVLCLGVSATGAQSAAPAVTVGCLVSAAERYVPSVRPSDCLMKSSAAFSATRFSSRSGDTTPLNDLRWASWTASQAEGRSGQTTITLDTPRLGCPPEAPGRPGQRSFSRLTLTRGGKTQVAALPVVPCGRLLDSWPAKHVSVGLPKSLTEPEVFMELKVDPTMPLATEVTFNLPAKRTLKVTGIHIDSWGLRTGRISGTGAICDSTGSCGRPAPLVVRFRSLTQVVLCGGSVSQHSATYLEFRLSGLPGLPEQWGLTASGPC